MRTHMMRLCLGLLPVLAACGITDVQAPALQLWEEVGDPFVETLDAAGLESVVQEGEAEFELALYSDGVTVGELTVRTEGDPRKERIQSRIQSFDESNGGRMTLALGDLEVSLASETRFWVDDVQVSREDFVARVQDDLAAGRKSPVAAERDASLQAQAPDNSSFVAGDVILGGDGAPALRMRAGRRHLERVLNPSGSSPDAWMRLLGWRLRLLFRDGTTRGERHRHHFNLLEEFEGEVAAIDLETRTLTLSDGSSVRLAGRTLIIQREGHAQSLRAAAEALAAGHAIRARGLGVVEGDGRILALKVALKIEEREPEPVVMDFESVVTDAYPGDVGTIVTLANGMTLRVGSTTELVPADAHSPATVQELMDALEDGREVIARGYGHVVGDNPLVLAAKRMELQAEAPPLPTSDVVIGNADYVSPSGDVILIDGTTVVITSGTQVVPGNAHSPTTIQELMDMLDQNRRILVTGEGTLDPQLRQLTAGRVVLTAVIGTFDQDVQAIEPYAGGLILADGTFVLLTQATVITPVNNGPADLFEVDVALYNGFTVRARGTGYVMGRMPMPGSPDSVEAIEVYLEQF